MSQPSTLDIVLKKTPKSFSAKPKHEEDYTKPNYETYELLSDAAFDTITNPPKLVKTPGFIKRLRNRLAFKFKRYLVNQRLKKFYSKIKTVNSLVMRIQLLLKMKLKIS